MNKPDSYAVFCDVYRNGELVAKRDKVLQRKLECEAENMPEEHILMEAEANIQKHFDYRIAEECITDTFFQGMSTQNVIELSFREPYYNVLIEELYTNFEIVFFNSITEGIPHIELEINVDDEF